MSVLWKIKGKQGEGKREGQREQWRENTKYVIKNYNVFLPSLSPSLSGCVYSIARMSENVDYRGKEGMLR